MSCDRYNAFLKGEIDPDSMAEHLDHCSSCRRAKEMDERLLELTSCLPSPEADEKLWYRIRGALLQEREQHRLRPRWTQLAAAAVLLLAVGILTHPFRTAYSQDSEAILSGSLLQRVEKLENQHLKAIEDLQGKIEPVLNGMDGDLARLYRERLDVIDDQIAECRQALEENPQNGHIRRYLLAALQDKKETLLEIRSSRTGRG